MTTVPGQSRARTTKRPPAIRVEDVQPVVECGRAPAKRCLGDDVRVTATVFTHGQKAVRAGIRYRQVGERGWRRAAMAPVPDEPDRFAGTFTATDLGLWEFGVEAWTDPVAAWQDEVRRKLAAGQADLSSELSEGERLVGGPIESPEAALALDQAGRADEVRPERTHLLDVDPVLARFGAWYELFPRSFGGLRAVEDALPQLADLGFDVVYLPPIHPIGSTNRKGPNNAKVAEPGDPGSPWAIGAAAGGHTAVEPSLGTIDDFDRLVESARGLGLEIALDIAFQASPDHPWVEEHPEWFRRRPDGTVAYAENPPKRYEDIVNFDLDGEAWESLWDALTGVVEFWIDHGVRVFRVDNPHTKPLPFWSFLIDRVRREHPDVIFLSEAFTRPAMMHALAKVGFDQSYTYFTWRNTAAELAQYVTELAGPAHEYFRPNFFTNTPDILTEYLQHGGEAAFYARLVLAATLSPAYGIYSGFEHFERLPREPGSEEYLDSEKYECKNRSLDGPMLPFIRRINQIRRAHPALQHLDNVTVLESAHESLLAFAKQTGDDTVVVCVNVDPAGHAEGLAVVPRSLGLPDTFFAHDLLADTEYSWRTGGNYVLLPPGGAHVLSIS